MRQKRSLSIVQSHSRDSLIAYSSHQLQNIIKNHITTELKLALKSMFDQGDDVVLELENEAQNIGNQTQILEAMRLVRLQKEKMTSEFFVYFEESFAKQLNNCHSAGLSTEDYLYNDEYCRFAAHENETLEIRASVDKLADVIKRRQWEMQSLLTKRFSELMGHQYDVNNYPISAWLICEAFAKVVSRLKTKLSKKLIIIKMFECSVIPELEQIYNKIDQIMAENDVAQIVENDTRNVEMQIPLNMQTVSPSSLSKSELDYNVNRFIAMQKMLHADGEDGTQLIETDLDQSGAMAARLYSVDDVITGLSVLQEKILMLDHTECIAINSNVKPHLFKLLNIMSGEHHDLELDRKCSDVVDIVTMMFDFILDDVALPLQLRSIIIRLQVPIIKVAILDDEFFNSRLQSARQLLNELAYSANVLHLVNQSKNQKDNLILVRVERIVDSILKSFTMDVDMFTVELQEFQKFMRSVLKGRKEKTRRLQIAKDIVVTEIKQRLTTQNVPYVVEVFIKQVWNDVLTKVGLATRCEGKTWQAILQVTDDLIWTTQPKFMLEERQLMTKMIPKLLVRLKEGLCLIDYSRPLMDRFFRHMEHIHLNSLRGVQESTPPTDAISLRDKKVGFHYAINDKDTDMISVSTDVYPNSEPGNKPELTDVQAFCLGLPDVDATSNPSYITVTEMPIGTWVAFSMDNQVSIGKLEWKCDFTEEFRFVDRNATIVHSDNLQNLVKLFDQSKARVIDDIPLFERAVDAVYHELQVA